MLNKEIVNKANKSLNGFLKEYNKSKQPAEINFRSLVDWIQPNSRSSHFIHSYPAKLLMHIPNYFLTTDLLSKEGDLIFDPFCGSGTVLLEANLNNRKAYGIDVNPIAVLISKVKTTNYNIDSLKAKKIDLIKSYVDIGSIPDVINIDYWFTHRIKNDLSCILNSINLLEESIDKNFFKICLSICSRKLSYADPNVAVPVKLQSKISKNIDFNSRAKIHDDFILKVNAFDFFSNVVDSTIDIIKRNEGINFLSEIVCEDIRQFIPDKEQVDFIITSPPYAGAQKYIRATSLNLGWIELCKGSELNKLEKKTVGREHYATTDYNKIQETGIYEADILLREIYQINPLRAFIASNYLLEMRQSMYNATLKLKKNGYLVLIIGNNVVCGKEFNTQSYIEHILNEFGLKTRLKLFDTIKSRGLMTKRNKTASLITREWVILLQKE